MTAPLLHRLASSLPAALCVLTGPAWALDVDSGRRAPELAAEIAAAANDWRAAEGFDGWAAAGWVRLRGIAEPVPGRAEQAPVPEAEVERTRAALRELRARGLKSCVMLRWPAPDWRRRYLPEDLGTVYARGHFLGSAYGDLVDAWEIDNEPDLGFVPENAERYAAFLKAMYWGIRRGADEAKPETGDLRPETRDLRAEIGDLRAEIGDLKAETGDRRLESVGSDSGPAPAPRVLMASLGLPPGPWLEQFVANDGFAYTDGYNYHYYGYAADFTAYYRLHEAAAVRLAHAHLAATGEVPVPPALPVFMTEIGYGLLHQQARQTQEGRLRQWRWFRSVAAQASALRIEAPMAFYLPPYLEYESNEYGLTMPAASVDGERSAAPAVEGSEVFSAGGIGYRPEDFGAAGAEPWMAGIGRAFGGNEATPALAAWWAERAAHHRADRESGRWRIPAPRPSPVVLDFLPDRGVHPVKRFNGHFVIPREPVVEVAAAPAPAAPPAAAPAREPPPPPPHRENLLIQVRTADDNLFEVYPLRPVGADWQNYIEPQANFTLSPYSRAAGDWRFAAGRPVALMISTRLQKVPATIEVRGVRLVRLEAPAGESAGPPRRHGRARVVLYNFSPQPVTGRLRLPEFMTAEADADLRLEPGERREVPVTIALPVADHARQKATVRFVADDEAVPPARLETALLAGWEWSAMTTVADLLEQGAEGGMVARSAAFLRERRPVEEEVPRREQRAAGAEWVHFAGHPAVQVERTMEGFRIVVAGGEAPEGTPVAVEIPWPDAAGFPADALLRLDLRVVPAAP